jgi:hypothetical protein
MTSANDLARLDLHPAGLNRMNLHGPLISASDRLHRRPIRPR